MAVDKSQSHRAGVLKQTNKEHKHGRHKSKGALNNAAKGKVHWFSPLAFNWLGLLRLGKVSVKNAARRRKGDLTREQRRNQNTQIRQNKRDDILARKRALGGFEAPPFLIAVLPLNKEFDPTTALTILYQCDENAITRKTSTGVTHIWYTRAPHPTTNFYNWLFFSLPRFKKKFSFIVPANDNELDVLDILKVADQVLLLLSAINATESIEQIVDQWGNKILRSCLAQVRKFSLTNHQPLDWFCAVF